MEAGTEIMEKRFVVLSQDELDRMFQKAAQIGAKAAMARYETEVRNSGRRKLHNADLLLRNYRMLKENLVNAVDDIQRFESELEADEILSMMMNKDTDESIAIQSIKRSKVRTAIIVKHIDTMLDIYQAYCQKSPDGMDMRRYEAIMDRYIREEEYTVTEIANRFFVSEKTIYRDISIGKTQLAALIFGVDGLNIR